MKREHWKALLPVITAFANGAAVELKSSATGKWDAKEYFDFCNPPENYRIKKPERWINLYQRLNGEVYGGAIYESEKTAREFAEEHKSRSSDPYLKTIQLD